ncbi:transporter substrate-binding domain-containing protein [Photobacterium sp. SDRW27]|uniref:transporter substrate-binding domain-containing protein n=1 Tax=Photobacterium obscurum TaxID=2829490 RepID=UPI0022432E9C|nr:transporter substrate-binding domain-containing protein [Photobacterium obscurum]MCW8328350.1 transporter substrate-binding domain-containing protein [Photobacterium obscurum]
MKILYRWSRYFTTSCGLIFVLWAVVAQAEPPLTAPPAVSKPHIRVGLPSFSFPPYTYITEKISPQAAINKHTTSSKRVDGLLIDVLDQVAKHADFTYDIILFPTYDDVIAAFQANELDLLPGVTSTFSRQQYMAFSEPMFSIRRAVITQGKPINQYQELDGKQIAIEQGFALQELLPSLIPETTLFSVADSQHAIEAIQSGKADGYIGDSVVLSDLLQLQNDTSLELSILPGLPTNHLHFATQKGKHKLLSRINFALEDIKAHTLKAIYNQWLTPEQINMFTNYGQLRLTAEERGWLDKNPYLTIGVRDNWAPYDYLNTQNAHTGLTADLLTILSNELGVKFKISSQKQFSDLNQAFLDGELMMLSALSQTAAQEKLMYFSSPYVSEPWVLFAPAEEKIDTLFSNNRLKVAIIADTSGAELLPSLCSECVPISYINQLSAFQALQKEEVDRVLTSLHHASPLLQSDYIGQFKMIGQIEEKNLVPLRFAINFRHPILLNIINKAISAIPPKELKRLENKWLTFEYQEGLAPREVAKWAGIITLFTLVVIIAIICWNRKMAEEIQQRKAAEKRAKRAEKRLQHLADNLDGVVLQHIQLSPEHPFDIYYSFVSAGVKELLGVSATSIKERPETLLNLLEGLDMAELKQSMLQAINVGHWSREQQLKCYQGKLKWVQFNSRITPREDGGFYWNTVATDITLLKQQQLAIENARQKAEIATAAKSQFLATISHEVRTPISGILGLLELMADQPLNDELINLHGGLTQSARNMLHIVNDVLDYSKIEAGKLELTPTNIELGKVLARIIQPQSIHAQQKNLAFQYWQDPTLAGWHFADDIRLHQILNNFLNNAIKFTEQGTIGLSIDVLHEHDSDNQPNQQVIRFTISDTGIGISPEQQKTLFRPFEQADQSTSRRFGGTGLGLAIARKLIEQMHGKISLSSQLGKGSQFSVTVTLPLGEPDTSIASIQPKSVDTSVTEHLDGNSLIIGYFIQREELYRYLQHLHLEPKMLTLDHPKILKEEALNHQPSYIFIAMAIWQQLGIDEQWLKEHLPNVKVIIINQNPMLSPEPIGQQWCLSVNPLLPDNLKHVLTKPISEIQTELSDFVLTDRMTESRESAEANGRLILVAEDHPINRQVISKQLEKIGIHADIVENGFQAIEATKNHRYGLLLTDCHMPEMDGYTLAATIRQQERYAIEAENSDNLTSSELLKRFGPTISNSYWRQHAINTTQGVLVAGLPIIALTANAIQGEDNRCYEMGMNDFLIKPVSAAKLKEVLWKWLNAEIQDQGSTNQEPQAEQQYCANEFLDLFSAIDEQLAIKATDKGSEHSFPQPVLTTGKSHSVAHIQHQSSVLDEQQILLLFEDKEVVEKLMAEFRQNHLQDFTLLEQAISECNQEKISLIAHRMKGASRMLECEALAAPLESIETAANLNQFSIENTAYRTLKELTVQLLNEEA